MKKNLILLTTFTLSLITFYGCESSKNNNSTPIDLGEYFEKSDRVNSMVKIYESSDYDEPTVTYYTDNVVVNKNLITHEIYGQPTFIIDIQSNDINLTDRQNNFNYLIKRHAHIGEEISSYSIDRTLTEFNMHVKQTEKCILESKIDTLSLKTPDTNVTYEDDIIVQMCTVTGTETYFDTNESFNFTDTYQQYFAKDKGRILAINKDCFVPHINTNPNNTKTQYELNDASNECSKTRTVRDLLLE